MKGIQNLLQASKLTFNADLNGPLLAALQVEIILAYMMLFYLYHDVFCLYMCVDTSVKSRDKMSQLSKRYFCSPSRIVGAVFRCTSQTTQRSSRLPYSMGQKNGLCTFGYNSAESEPIWMKSGIV